MRDTEEDLNVDDEEQPAKIAPDDDMEVDQENLPDTEPETEPETEEADTLAPSVSDNDATIPVSISLATLLQTPGFEIVCDGYELCDSYSGADEGELAFEMSASPHKKLLVLKFKVTNVSGQDQVFDVLSKGARARVRAAGGSQGALLTLLENDLLTASMTMAADQSRIFVILSQVDEGSIVDSVELHLTA